MNKEEEINIQFLGQFIQEGIYLLPEEMQKPKSSKQEEKREDTQAKEEINLESEDLIPILPQLGEFRKQVLILVNNASNSIISNEEKEFFSKLIPAIKLTWTDVAVVNINSIANNEQDLFDFIQSYEYTFLLAFTGQISSLKRTFDVELYTPNKSAGKIHLLANPVSELNGDKSQKVKLWDELKQIF